MTKAARHKNSVAWESSAGGSQRRGHRRAAIAVVVLAGALRLIGLNTVPPGINQDEAERAYDAYCLRATGQDHLGVRWPIFFRAFGNADYPPGTYIYGLIPFQALLGMNVWSTRLPVALLGTLNVWWLYLLVKRIYGERAGLCAALLLAVSPWHLHLSRLAFEVSLCPPLVTLGFLLLTPSSRSRHRFVHLALAGAAFGLALWTYNAFRVVVPLLFFGAATIYAKPIWRFMRGPRGLYGAATWLVGLIVGMSPLIWASVQTPTQAWARASATSFLAEEMTVSAKALKLCRTYLLHLSPGYLFFTGDKSAIHGMSGYGKLHYFCALLLPLGLARTIWRWRTERFGQLLLWWVIVAPLPAAVTNLDSAHTLRSTGVVPAYDILSAIGLDLLLSAVAQQGSKAYRMSLACMLVVVGLNVGYFLFQYYTQYPKDAAGAFQAEWGPAFQDLRRRMPDYSATLLTSRDTNQLAMLYLFYNQVDPKQYFAKPRIILEGSEWDFIIRVENYFFVTSDFLGKVAREFPAGSKFLVAERPNVAVPGVELRRFSYPTAPHGETVLILYEVATQTAPTQ